MAKTRHIEQIDPKYLVRITNDRTPGWNVVSHIPEEFGFSVGSEISTPFASYASDGKIASLLALYYGASAKLGIVTTKAYMGPEPTEFSFPLEFEAYYSGYEEVIIPVVQLMVMSIGETERLADSLQTAVKTLGIDLGQIANNILDSTTDADGAKKVSTVADYIQYMRSPGVSTIRFGNVFKVNNAFIANVEPSFSNIMDNQGFPMKATVNVSVQLQIPFSKVSLIKAFSSNVGRTSDPLNPGGLDSDNN